MKNKKTKKWIIVVIVVTAILGIIVYFYKHSNKPVVQPTITVTKGNIIEKAEAVGYIKPMHVIIIKSQVSGTVAQLYHDEGDYVKKGELLLKVKPEPEPANYAEAYQNVEKAKDVLASTQVDFARYKKALHDHIITANYTDYIAAKKNYDTAREDLLLAKQKLALLKNGSINVGGEPIANVVTSPITGYILYRAVDVGDPVISLSSYQSSTPLFTMANMKGLLFEGTIDEMDAAKVKVGMLAKITIGAFPRQKITGTLGQIALQSDQENSLQTNNASSSSDSNDSPFNVGFDVKVENLHLPTTFHLRSGYSATADILIQTKKNVLMIPERVVYFDKKRPYVLLPSDNSKKPIQKNVVLGISDSVNVEIKKGLTLGEKVLDNPKINDNQS